MSHVHTPLLSGSSSVTMRRSNNRLSIQGASPLPMPTATLGNDTAPLDKCGRRCDGQRDGCAVHHTCALQLDGSIALAARA